MSGELTARRAAACAAVAAVVAHAGALGAGLVYDDNVLIGQTAFLADSGSFGALLDPDRYFASGELSWRPLTVALHIVQRSWLGGVPWLLHAMSLAVHAAAAWMCARFISATGAAPAAALLGALLFAVHPVMGEAVNLVTFVEDPLATLLLLWGAWLAARGPGGAARAAALGGLALAAMGAKETGLMALPLWGCAALGGHLARGETPSLKAWWPAAAAVAAATALFAGLRFGLMANPGAGDVPGLPGGPAGIVRGDLWILSRYALFLLLPVSQCIDWTVPEPVPWMGAIVGALVVAAAGWAAWRCRKTAPGVSLGLLWAALALAPVMNLVPLSIPIAERFLYLPMAGLAWALAASGGARLAEADAARRQPAVYAVAALCLLAAVRTQIRARHFTDEVRLWEATRAVNSQSVRAAMMLAQAYQAPPHRDLAASVRTYREILRRWPDQHDVRLHLAVALQHAARALAEQQQDPREPLAEAERLLHESTQRWPDDWRAWLNLAQIAAERRDVAGSEQLIQQAIQVAPNRSEPRVMLALTRLSQRDLHGALQAIHDAPPQARDTPFFVMGQIQVWLSAGKIAESKQALAQAQARWGARGELANAANAIAQAEGAGRGPSRPPGGAPVPPGSPPGRR